jgi:hypothetical protein
MRKNEFIRYLTTPTNTNGNPYTQSTAKVKASHCSSIEKEYGMDLDRVFQDPAEEARLFNFVDSMKKVKLSEYQVALWNYKDFFHNPPALITRGHFQLYPDAALDGIDDDLLMRMEGEYECIMAFGRDEFFKKACQERIERIPVILSPEVKKKNYKLSDADIAKKICELVRAKNGNITEKEIMAILKNKDGFTDLITGEFIKEPEPKIILYYNAIGGKTSQKRIAGLANVLAHEYMHYMEYRYCLLRGVTSYKNEKLSEAMADFFGVLYLLQRRWFINYALNEKASVAEHRYNEWVNRFGTCWPYAEALHFYTVNGNTAGFSFNYADYVNNGATNKIVEVFINCFDYKRAYKIMLH